MNLHIELVKKWLSDNDSVSLEELEANRDAAYRADLACRAADLACRAADLAYWASYWDNKAGHTDYVNNVKYYKKLAIEAIKEYEELTK